MADTFDAGFELIFRLDKPASDRDVQRLLRAAQRAGFTAISEVPAIAETSVADDLKALARRYPIVSPDSFFGREHTALYSERLGTPSERLGTCQRRLSMLLRGMLEPPPRIVNPPYGPPGYTQKTREEHFPGMNIDVRPRTEVGLETLSGRLLNTSYGPSGVVNTHAIKVESVFAFGENPSVAKGLCGVASKGVDLLQDLIGLIRSDIDAAQPSTE